MTCCPRCNVELEMVQVGLDQAGLCRQCDGVLLKKLDPLLDLSEDDLRNSPLNESLYFDHPEVDVTPPVGCPLCAQTMRRYVYAGDSGITLDSCPAGHGIWLDDGELARVYDYIHHIDSLPENLEPVSQADMVTLVMNSFPRRYPPPTA